MQGKTYYRNKRKTVVGSEERKVNTQGEVVKMRTKQVTPLHTDAFWCCSSLRDGTEGHLARRCYDSSWYL